MLTMEFDDEQLAVQDLARDLGARVLAPAARAAEEQRGVPRDVWSTLFETGLTSAAPPEHGGGGVPDAVTFLLAVEALAHGDAGIAMAAIWSGATSLLVSVAGTSAQQAALLPALNASSDVRGAVAMFEGFGRAPSEYRTTFSPTPSGRWRIVGEKVAVPFVDGAIAVVVVGTGALDGRLRAAMLNGPNPGVRVAPSSVNGRLALDAAPLHRISVDVEVGDEALLGGPASNGAALATAVARLRLAIGAAAMGTAARATEYASAYANERIAFGKPIAAFQGVSFLIAESAIRLEAARLGLWDAASRLDAGILDERGVTVALNYATTVAAAVTRDAVQVLGGHGFIRDHPVELWYRSAAALSCIDFDPTCSAFEPAL